ncbi:unnamed protein product [Ambrosiozyma monospora]|uniref:Unnamed protein product n=1 Tax=Ambrosiozyma monospora TaxID=43982 RepID=A0A9W6YV72_AMBMO|nr:unnamed protein product [Ambrosiozyma monospora]
MEKFVVLTPVLNMNTTITIPNNNPPQTLLSSIQINTSISDPSNSNGNGTNKNLLLTPGFEHTQSDLSKKVNFKDNKKQPSGTTKRKAVKRYQTTESEIKEARSIADVPLSPTLLNQFDSIRNDSLTSTNHKKFKILSNTPTPISRTTIMKGIETFYEQQKSRFNNIPITCGFDNYNPNVVYINHAQLYDLSDEMSEDDYNDSITSLFVCISMHRFEDEEQVTYTLGSMDSESTNKVVTL